MKEGVNSIFGLLDPAVLNGFFICASITLLCLGIAILVMSFKS